jgi:hypothetical protein
MKISFEKYIQMQCYVAAQLGDVQYIDHWKHNIAVSAKDQVDEILRINNCEVETITDKPVPVPTPTSGSLLCGYGTISR